VNSLVPGTHIILEGARAIEAFAGTQPQAEPPLDDNAVTNTADTVQRPALGVKVTGMPRRAVKYLARWVETRRHRWYLRIFGERLMDHHLWSMSRHSITAAFGAGIAIAFIPLPVHTIVAVLAALYWGLNLPVTLASTWVVNPFTVVPCFYGAYRLGALLLHHPTHQFAFHPSWRWLEHGLGPLWKPFLLGCLVSAIVAGLLGRWGLELAWRTVVRRKFRLRHAHRASS